MKTTTTKILYSYWNEIRGSRIAPRRFEIEPASIAGILPDTFILEYSNLKSINFRLSGTRICDLFAQEFRGQSIYSLWSEEDRASIEEALASIVESGSVALTQASALTGSNRELTVEVIMMPLVHSGENINRIIGSLSTNQYDPNIELRQDPASSLEILESTQIWPDGRPHNLLPNSILASALPPKIVTSRNCRFKVYEGGLSRDPSRDHQ